MKFHEESLQKGSKEYQYVVQKLKWSGVYPRNNCYNAIPQKVLMLVKFTETGLKVYVATTTKFLSYLYDALEGNINCLKSLKLKRYMVENIKYFYIAILVGSECLKSAVVFKTENLV